MELLLVIFFIASFISIVITNIIYTYFNEDNEVEFAAYSSAILFLGIAVVLAIWHVIEFLNTN